jgi:hypothetical protein
MLLCTPATHCLENPTICSEPKQPAPAPCPLDFERPEENGPSEKEITECIMHWAKESGWDQDEYEAELELCLGAGYAAQERRRARIMEGASEAAVRCWGSGEGGFGLQ